MAPSRTLIAALIGAASLSAAHAQAPATPAPVVAAPVAAPKCEKPEFPGRVAVDARIKKYGTDFRAYADCLKTYIAERNAAIDANAKAAKGAVDDFNAGVTEFNAAMKSMND